MAKYPLSIMDREHDGKMAESFAQLMYMHVPRGSKILDPTAGKRLLWQSMLPDLQQLAFVPAPYEIVFSDIKEGNEGNEQQNLARARTDRPEWLDAFDVVVYDPPYFVGADSKDPREGTYGGYDYSTADLEMYMRLTHAVIPDLLKPGGKLILKCSDQYVVPERKFYLHHYDWLTYMMRAFEIIDSMIYRYHRMSPTSFQVKERPCSVIMHSYFFVGILRPLESFADQVMKSVPIGKE